MSQRRTGGTSGNAFGGGASGGGAADGYDDIEHAELEEEMGRLSPSSSSSAAATALGSRSGARHGTMEPRSVLTQNIGLLLIWLFIAISITFTMLTGTRSIDAIHRMGKGWAWQEASRNPDDLWAKGSGRKNLNFNSSFNPDDLTMTEDECDAFFPDLYKEVDRSVKYYTEHKTFDRAYLERTCDDGFWTHARVLIYNNRLYIKYYTPAGFTRGEAALALLHQSLITSREKLPNVEFCIGLHDWASMGKFSLDRPPEVEDAWLMPDYSFFSWPEHVGMYNEMREKERKIDQEIGWSGKSSTLFWRGSMKVGTPDREALMAEAKGYAWNEMSEIVWGSPDKGPILLEDHCRYKFHAYPDGNTYSGRLRYLQNCKVVVVTHPQHWIQHYTHLFNGEWGHPDQNIVYIPAPLDSDPSKGVIVHNAEGIETGRSRAWERLPEVMDKLLKDDAMAERIADNVLKTFRDRYVVPATAMCFWRRSLRSFATIQKYDVHLDGTETSYENFVLHGMRKPDQNT